MKVLYKKLLGGRPRSSASIASRYFALIFVRAETVATSSPCARRARCSVSPTENIASCWLTYGYNTTVGEKLPNGDDLGGGGDLEPPRSFEVVPAITYSAEVRGAV